MVVVLGLLVLLAAAAVAVVGFASNGGSSHPLGGDLTIAGLHLSGMSIGQLFLYGVVVGAVGMLGLSMLLGTFSQRLASRGSRRQLRGSQREAEGLRLDHERLSRELEDERAAHSPAVLVPPAEPVTAVGNGTSPAGSEAAPDGDLQSLHEPTAALRVPDHPGLLHRIGHRTGSRS
jgi:hypothetical protein